MEILQLSDRIIFNKIKCNLKINYSTIRIWLENLIAEENKELINLTYSFCKDEYLLNINKKYLNHDYFTDIITFDLSDSKNQIEGDIYISIERVRDNAKQANTSVEEELLRILAHGLLHLIGYDDKTLGEKKKMRKKENFYINKYYL